MNTISRREAEAIALSLAEGKGVVIRDTQGIGEPHLGRIVKITDEFALVALEDGRPVRFERSTGFAMQPGNHDRWQLSACGPPSSAEFDGLRTREARLQRKVADLQRKLDVVTAVLETAEQVAMGGKASTR